MSSRTVLFALTAVLVLACAACGRDDRAISTVPIQLSETDSPANHVREVQSAPLDSVTDLAAEFTGDGVMLDFFFRLEGDYNRDNTTDGKDIFPLAVSFQQHSDYNGNTAEEPLNNCIDGNRDGVLDGKDLFLIAVNFQRTFDGFNAYHSIFADGWGGSFDSVAAAEPQDTDCHSSYQVLDERPLQGTNYLKVRPYDGEDEGPDSNVFELSFPVWIYECGVNSDPVRWGHPTPLTLGVAGGSLPYEYLWDFGNGDVSTEALPSYVYPEEGDYSVTITVSDDAGGEDSCGFELTVLDVGVEITAVTSNLIWPGESVTFTAEVTPPEYQADIHWYMGDGDFTPKHQGELEVSRGFDNPGVYPVLAVLEVGSLSLVSEPEYVQVMHPVPQNGVAVYPEKYLYTPTGGDSMFVHVFSNIGEAHQGLKAAFSMLEQVVEFYGPTWVEDYGISPYSDGFFYWGVIDEPYFGSGVRNPTGEFPPGTEQVYALSTEFSLIKDEWPEENTHNSLMALPMATYDREPWGTYSMLVPPGDGTVKPFTFHWGGQCWFSTDRQSDLTVLPSLEFADESLFPPISVRLSAFVSGGTPPYTVDWDFGDGRAGTGLQVDHVYEDDPPQESRCWLIETTATDSSRPPNSVTVKQLSVPALTEEPLELNARIVPESSQEGPVISLLEVDGRAGNAYSTATLDVRFDGPFDQNADHAESGYKPLTWADQLFFGLGQTTVDFTIEDELGDSVSDTLVVDCSIPDPIPPDSIYLVLPGGDTVQAGEEFDVEVHVKEIAVDNRGAAIDLRFNGEGFGDYLTGVSATLNDDFWPEENLNFWESGEDFLGIVCGLIPTGESPDPTGLMFTVRLKALKPGMGYMVLNSRSTGISLESGDPYVPAFRIGAQVTITE